MGKSAFDDMNISDELKKRALAATSPEELLQIAREEGIELTDEQLEAISAGGASWAEMKDKYGDTRSDIDEALVSEAFRTGQDLGDEE